MIEHEKRVEWGRKRWEGKSKEEIREAMKKIAPLGGKARAEKMTEEERREYWTRIAKLPRKKA